MAITYLLGSFPDIIRERVALAQEFSGLPMSQVLILSGFVRNIHIYGRFRIIQSKVVKFLSSFFRLVLSGRKSGISFLPYQAHIILPVTFTLHIRKTNFNLRSVVL